MMGEGQKTPGGRIELPSSGLAEDILGRYGMEAAGAPAEASPVPEEEAADRWGDALKKDEGASHHLVGFFLGEEEYALDIAEVQEIIRVGGWTRVPNTPGHIRGVINLRGRILPVVDPKARMGFAERPLTRDSRIMVVELGGRRVLGLLVDRVSEVLKVPEGLVEAAPEAVSDTDRGYVRGVGKLDGRLVILVDLHKLVGEGEAAPAAGR